MFTNHSKYPFLKAGKQNFLICSLLFCFLLCVNINLYADDSKHDVQAAIITKLTHYVRCHREHHSNQYTIATFEQSAFDRLSKYFSDTELQNKIVSIQLIRSIEEMKSQDLLFLEEIDYAQLPEIIQKAEKFNILTLANSRGFAERGVMIQIYQVGQKFKLKINISQLKQAGFKVHSSLLRISNIIKEKS